MSIFIDEQSMQFQLNAGETSYVMQVAHGYLQHLYWGAKLSEKDHSFMNRKQYHSSFNVNNEEGDFSYSLDVLPMEYPAYGRGDMRTSAFEMEHPNGSLIADLTYESYQLHKGKPAPKGLPATYCETDDECDTLEIVLCDRISGIRTHLFYCVYAKRNAICRFVRVENTGKETVILRKALSACLDLDRSDYVLAANYGAWARERNMEDVPLFHGKQEISSRRGSSSHNHNPFLILKEKAATETCGSAYGMTLVYSGSFEGFTDVDSFDTTRMGIGLNHEGFAWELTPGAFFDTPEAVLVYSDNGVGALSDTYHSLFRDRLCRGKYRNAPRPVLLNSWEACYFNFNEDKIESIAQEAHKLGVELLVVDDGWFGKRDSDNCSLGDWVPDKNKLPGGVGQLAKKVNAAGCALGIWFEPEMVNPDSDLYRAHPDWVLAIPGRPRSLGRLQAMLDLSRQDVQDYLFDSIAKVISDGNIAYIKWDFNRNFSEVGSALLPPEKQGEVSHRYYLGLYALLERLVTTFPDVLFESCSGGGGRFDAGMLYYMPQTWTSDNTDAMKRLFIQYGTSFVYPPSCMSAHISICPNHQTGTVSPFQTRMLVALTGSFGFELNPLELNDEDKEAFKKAVALYHQLGDLLVNGRYRRLVSPNAENYSAWSFTSADEKEIFAVAVNHCHRVNGGCQRFCLSDLTNDHRYKDTETGAIYTTDELLHYGLQVPFNIGDRAAASWHLCCID